MILFRNACGRLFKTLRNQEFTILLKRPGIRRLQNVTRGMLKQIWIKEVINDIALNYE